MFPGLFLPIAFKHELFLVCMVALKIHQQVRCNTGHCKLKQFLCSLFFTELFVVGYTYTYSYVNFIAGLDRFFFIFCSFNCLDSRLFSVMEYTVKLLIWIMNISTIHLVVNVGRSSIECIHWTKWVHISLLTNSPQYPTGWNYSPNLI